MLFARRVALLHKWLEVGFGCGESMATANFLHTHTQYVESHHMCKSSTVEYIDLASASGGGAVQGSTGQYGGVRPGKWGVKENTPPCFPG